MPIECQKTLKNMLEITSKNYPNFENLSKISKIVGIKMIYPFFPRSDHHPQNDSTLYNPDLPPRDTEIIYRVNRIQCIE